MLPDHKKLQFRPDYGFFSAEEVSRTLVDWILSVTSEKVRIEMSPRGTLVRFLYLSGREYLGHIVICSGKIYGSLVANSSYTHISISWDGPIGPRESQRLESDLLRWFGDQNLLVSALSSLIDGFEEGQEFSAEPRFIRH